MPTDKIWPPLKIPYFLIIGRRGVTILYIICHNLSVHISQRQLLLWRALHGKNIPWFSDGVIYIRLLQPVSCVFSFLCQNLWLSTPKFAALLYVHHTLNANRREFAFVKIAPMMEKRCAPQMERLTTTLVSFRRSHVKATPLWKLPGKVLVKVGFSYCLSSVCITVPFKTQPWRNRAI